MTLSAALQVAATAAALYVTAFVSVRLAGRRTVSQLSVFDALITITLGSILAGAMERILRPTVAARSPS